MATENVHENVQEQLARLVASVGLKPLSAEQATQFDAYFALLVRWNERTNLSAIRDRDGILQRHFLESIGCAQMLPEGIETLLDFGSGGGFPGVPVAICRAEIAVALAESQGKKAAFLQEVVRTLALQTRVHAGRAEQLKTSFDCVTLRAVDRMDAAVKTASTLVRPGGWMALLTTGSDAAELMEAAGPGFCWQEGKILPGSNRGILLLGRCES